MTTQNRRNNLDIQADLLRVARKNGGARKTWMVYGANLNFNIVKAYLESMIQDGLLELRGGLYYPTEKGEAFMASYAGLRTMMARDVTEMDLIHRYYAPI